jgi:hypothetical protein
MRISLTFSYGGKEEVFTGTLTDSPAALAVAAALPIQARASTWGDEIYFSIPVKAQLEAGAGDVREIGDLAYWPPGRAFCVFFGPTPASRGNEPRAASPVNVLGRLDIGPETVAGLKQVPPGARVVLTAGLAP